MSVLLQEKYITELKDLVEELEVNLMKFDKKNLTAGRRARGISMKIKHMQTDIRKDVLEKSKMTKSERTPKLKNTDNVKEEEQVSSDNQEIITNNEELNNEEIDNNHVEEEQEEKSNKKKKVSKKSSKKKKQILIKLLNFIVIIIFYALEIALKLDKNIDIEIEKIRNLLI